MLPMEVDQDTYFLSLSREQLKSTLTNYLKDIRSSIKVSLLNTEQNERTTNENR